MGIGIVVLLAGGWFGLELLGYSKSEVFQNLIYWACFLLLCAVHELSKRANKASEETQALRAEIDGARAELRSLQAARHSVGSSGNPGVPVRPWGPAG